jgi:hypothetical protein
MITSNGRPLWRAFCTVLLGIAALSVMPRNARAQSSFIIAHNGSTDPTTEGFTAIAENVGARVLQGLAPAYTDANPVVIAGAALDTRLGFRRTPCNHIRQTTRDFCAYRDLL